MVAPFVVMAVVVAALASLALSSAPATLPDCFLSMGDWGGANAVVTGMVAQMERILQNPAAFGCGSIPFLLALGDNFYDDGVDSTSDPQWMTTYRNQFRQNGTKMATLPFLVIAGNHDYDQAGDGSVSLSKVQAQIDYSLQDPYWIFPSVNYTKQYRLSGHAVRFVFVDMESIYLCSISNPNCFHTDQIAWVHSELAAADDDASIDGIVYVGHHNVVGALGGHADRRLDNVVLPTMEHHRVTVSVMAHSHYLAWGKNPNVTLSPNDASVFPGELWHITNGAARGSDWNSCVWQNDTPLTNLYCSNDTVSESGAFMLHRVEATGGITHCSISSVDGSQIDSCLFTPFRKFRSNPTTSSSLWDSPYLYGGIGGVAAIVVIAAVVLAVRKHHTSRRHAYAEMTSEYEKAF